jgi:hypothetical protein
MILPHWVRACFNIMMRSPPHMDIEKPGHARAAPFHFLVSKIRVRRLNQQGTTYGFFQLPFDPYELIKLLD